MATPPTPPNGNGAGNLPARTSGSAKGLLNLRRGNPGNKGGGDKTTAFRLRAQQKLEDAKGLDVVAGILQDTDEASDARLKAFRELRECAGYGAPKPINIDASGDVKILVVYDE